MRLLLTILFLTFSYLLSAKDTVEFDSTAVELRTITSSSLDQYKKDKDFQYETEVIQTPSFWDRFWSWFWDKWYELMSTAAGKVAMKIFYWALGIGAVAFFIFKVIKMNRQSLFAADVKTQTAYNIASEDIHAIPFDVAIDEAVQNQNYRLAIRLLYLRNLKTLSDQLIIAWQPNKTNTAYVNEITDIALRNFFKDITNIFEYAWYGSREISKEDYDAIKDQFIHFQNQR